MIFNNQFAPKWMSECIPNPVNLEELNSLKSTQIKFKLQIIQSRIKIQPHLVIQPMRSISSIKTFVNHHIYGLR